MPLTPQQIATASQCLTCADVFANEILTMLLARWAGGSTDPNTLSASSIPFQGFTGSEADAAFSYMLAVINGGSLDPNAVSQLAVCFECADGFQQRAQIYLLALITGSSTDSNDLAAAASGFQGIFNWTAVQLYLLSQKSGASASQLAVAIPCWCAAGQQDRIQTYLLSDIQS